MRYEYKAIDTTAVGVPYGGLDTSAASLALGLTEIYGKEGWLLVDCIGNRMVFVRCVEDDKRPASRPVVGKSWEGEAVEALSRLVEIKAAILGALGLNGNSQGTPEDVLAKLIESYRIVYDRAAKLQYREGELEKKLSAQAAEAADRDVKACSEERSVLRAVLGSMVDDMTVLDAIKLLGASYDSGRDVARSAQESLCKLMNYHGGVSLTSVVNSVVALVAELKNEETAAIRAARGGRTGAEKIIATQQAELDAIRNCLFNACDVKFGSTFKGVPVNEVKCSELVAFVCKTLVDVQREKERLRHSASDWERAAQSHAKNESFWCDIVFQCGVQLERLYGNEVYRTDEGALSHDRLALKVPELLKRCVDGAIADRLPMLWTHVPDYRMRPGHDGRCFVAPRTPTLTWTFVACADEVEDMVGGRFDEFGFFVGKS